jgi:hypothetical protein
VQPFVEPFGQLLESGSKPRFRQFRESAGCALRHVRVGARLVAHRPEDQHHPGVMVVVAETVIGETLQPFPQPLGGPFEVGLRVLEREPVEPFGGAVRAGQQVEGEELGVVVPSALLGA